VKNTATQGFPIPEDEDYGSQLQLQTLAEQFDTDLWNIQTRLTAQLQRTALIRTLTADFNLPTPAVEITWQQALNSTVYSHNWSPLNGFGIPPEPGTYMMGIFMNLRSTGAISVDTERRASVRALVPTGPGTADLRTITYTSSCNDGGVSTGVYLTTQGVFDVQDIPTNPVGPLISYVTHYNSSGCTIKAGAIMWSIKIAELMG
jgi:hypothetical protein